MVKLSQLVLELGGRLASTGDPELEDCHLDSRQVAAGTLFCALPGTQTDGSRFVQDALERGASAVLAPRSLELGETPLWIHPEARGVAGEAAAILHGHPARELSLVGITGTNGKSTTAHFCVQLLETLGKSTGLIGTIEYRLAGDRVLPATHTTPDAPELQRLLRRHLEAGGEALVLEASSHALDQERLAGLTLDVAVFTNLSQDHLDYHLDMQAYAAAKERLFGYLRPDGVAVCNADDEYGAAMVAAAERVSARVVTYGLGSRADLSASIDDIGPQGTYLFLEGMGIPRTGLMLPLLGRHNVENALAATAATLSLGASPSRVLEGLATVQTPRGRLEALDVGGRGFRVFIDYAHTPDALERVLRTMRALVSEEDPGEEGRVILVFGCGGERDVDKREPMGSLAGSLADVVVVTSDNPRHEDPELILAAVLRGLEGAGIDVYVEPERRLAIRQALRLAESGDVVLIAGKGHEAWQLVRGRRLPFDDRTVVLEELP